MEIFLHLKIISSTSKILFIKIRRFASQEGKKNNVFKNFGSNNINLTKINLKENSHIKITENIKKNTKIKEKDDSAFSHSTSLLNSQNNVK